jgi:hypothetical protein
VFLSGQFAGEHVAHKKGIGRFDTGILHRRDDGVMSQLS